MRKEKLNLIRYLIIFYKCDVIENSNGPICSEKYRIISSSFHPWSFFLHSDGYGGIRRVRSAIGAAIGVTYLCCEPAECEQ